MEFSRKTIVDLTRMSVLNKPVSFAKRAIIKTARVTGLNKFKGEQGLFLGNRESFFQSLAENNIEYVVLRWFENISNLKDGDDIDILVSDADYVKIQSFTDKGRLNKPGFIKVDIYPESNQVGHISYYPPKLARRVLDGRIKLESGVWVPNPTDYFFSLSYHALFHKGFRSGLNSIHLSEAVVKRERNYEKYLLELTKQANLKIDEINMESLEKFLLENDWLPPLDVYFRRAPMNEWVKKRAKIHLNPEWRRKKGTAVFILREKLTSPIMLTKFEQLIKEKGITTLNKIELSTDEAEIFAQKTRGGDWVKKNAEFAFGGLPKLVYIVRNETEYGAQTEDEDIPKGAVMYNWVMEIKKDIRNEYAKNVKFHEKCHIIHTSDNGVEAALYISILESIISKELVK